jgi:aconitate hydratase
MEEILSKNEIYGVTVLSGNRNFSGRIHPLAKGNFLASPPLVVIYALAGRIDIDLYNEPIGYDPNGEAVYLRDIWPSIEEINDALEKVVKPDIFVEKYASIMEGDDNWNKLKSIKSTTYEWDPRSTYIVRPPFFDNMPLDPPELDDLRGLRILVWAPDRTTTDHISPASRISPDSKAGEYLRESGVPIHLLNTFGSRRGNHEVMMRGTFDNPRFVNMLVGDKEGGWTIYWPENKIMHIYEASRRYKMDGIPLMVIGGKQYGVGSSRDWAAKGPYLLGVKAVLAESYERIHRSNLIGMGILPLEFMPGENANKLGLDGSEVYDIIGIKDGLYPGKILTVIARKKDGARVEFKVKARLDTPIEVEYYRHGGILQYVLRNLLRSDP